LDIRPFPCKFTLPLFPGLTFRAAADTIFQKSMIHTFLNILADTAAAPATGGPGIGSFVPLACIVAIFYFVAIRPGNLKQKQLDAMVKAVKTGDKIVTSSGIHGVITNVKDSTVIVRVADNVKLEIEKSHIDKINRPESADSDKTPAKA
jgi:preprotein translocase subunit YajC